MDVDVARDPGTAPARAVRWGVALVVLLVVTYAAIAGGSELGDPDVWWVAAAGREGLTHGSFPRLNLFSFTDPAHPWLMHEWLFAAPFARLLTWCGPRSFALVAVAEFALAVGILGQFLLSQTTRLLTGIALLLATIALFGDRFLSPRPTAVGVLVCLAFATLVFRPGLTAQRGAWLVLLELLWVNAHGSFVIGVYLIASSVVLYRAEWRRRGLVALAVAGVTLLNPFGLAMHRFVVEYFLGRKDIYAVIAKHITDFQPLYRFSFGEAKRLWIAVVLQLLLALGALARPGHRVRGALALALVLVEVKNVRHVPLAGLVAVVLLTPYIDQLCRALSTTVEDRRTRFAPLALSLGTVFAGVFAYVVHENSGPPAAAFETTDGTSGAAWIEGLAQVPDGAKVFVPFSAGGVAIWFGWPRGVRVFFDPRNDCYSARTAEDAFAIESAKGAPAELLVQAGTTHVLVPKDHPLAAVLRAGRDYAVVRETRELVLFARPAAVGLL